MVGCVCGMNFETSVRIDRPMDQVFDYVSDPINFPRWNSAVQSVQRISAGDDGVGATYRMERELPGGRSENELEVLPVQRPTEFEIRTTSGADAVRLSLPRSRKMGATTVVELAAEVELGGIAGALGPLASRAVKRGVDSNFADLKRFLEAAEGR